jgi:GAF domain-containing protein
MAMVPVRSSDPIAALAAHWATHHQATEDELDLLKLLADTIARVLSRHSESSARAKPL